MNRSPIPWLGANGFTWNPITGCTKGCDYCYARKIAARFATGTKRNATSTHAMPAVGREVFPAAFWPTTYSARLEDPARRKKPATIFVGSMGDLFDDAFADSFRDAVFVSMAQARQHNFVLLTKQAENMRRYVASRTEGGMTWREGITHRPMPNLILGVTVTNQADADTRIPLLLETPAAYRMVSVEPMLGPVDLSFINATPPLNALVGVRALMKGEAESVLIPSLDFVAIGAKTPGKPLHERWDCDWQSRTDRCPHYVDPNDLTSPFESECQKLALTPCIGYPRDWLRTLLEQCTAARVPVNYKHGNTTPAVDGITYDCTLAELVKP